MRGKKNNIHLNKTHVAINFNRRISILIVVHSSAHFIIDGKISWCTIKSKIDANRAIEIRFELNFNGSPQRNALPQRLHSQHLFHAYEHRWILDFFRKLSVVVCLLETNKKKNTRKTRTHTPLSFECSFPSSIDFQTCYVCLSVDEKILNSFAHFDANEITHDI